MFLRSKQTGNCEEDSFVINMRIVGLCLAVLFSVGCASPNNNARTYRSAPVNPVLSIVAADLVSVLAQLPGFDAWSMTAQVSPASSEYGEALIDALRTAGYGVQRVSADQGRNYLEYRKVVSSNEVGDSTAFELKIRNVYVARDYEWRGSRWVPSSPVRIRGVEPTKVNVYNELYGQRGKTTEFVSGVEFVDDAGAVIESRSAMAKVSGVQPNYGARYLELRVLIMSRASIFSRQRSTVDQDTRTYRPISNVVLTFPNADPNLLGDLNKQAIVAMVNQMDPDLDRFVIRGCSHGKSLIWDGNEITSLNRQQRVNQELLVAGIQSDSIVETGCFAAENEIELPKQSVRLTLQRATQPL